MQRFVLGTGRCGSTLLSRMLAECPAVTSLSEFCNGLDMARRFDPAPIDGPAYAALIGAEQPFVTAVLRRGYRVEEITYPFADEPVGPGAPPRGRRRSRDALPWILVSMLPRLSEDPDRLFEEVLAHAAGGAAMPAPNHHLRLFDFLAARAGRSGWIERSGSSLDYGADLLRAFPEARVVHIHRDGPEVALSMRDHAAYRLPISLLYDTPLDDGARVSELDPLDFDATPRIDDTISRILRSQPPPEHFGRYWSDQILRGQPALETLPAEQLLVVAFADLVSRPRPTLDRIATFFALGPEGADRDTWTHRAAALVRGTPASRLDTLSPSERDRLVEACAPGRAAMSPPT